MEYWKFDTHTTDSSGEPLSRSALDPTIREYRKIRKEGFGQHRIFTDDSSDPYPSW